MTHNLTSVDFELDLQDILSKYNGKIDADVIAECYNTIARRNEFEDRLIGVWKDDLK